MGTYEVTVNAIGSCYQGSITQTWEIIEKDAAAQSAVTVTYKPSTSGLPRVWATLVVAQYSGDRMVDVRVKSVYGSNTYFPGTSFDETKGDTYTAFLLNTSNVPLSKATKN